MNLVLPTPHIPPDTDIYRGRNRLLSGSRPVFGTRRCVRESRPAGPPAPSRESVPLCPNRCSVMTNSLNDRRTYVILTSPRPRGKSYRHRAQKPLLRRRWPAVVRYRSAIAGIICPTLMNIFPASMTRILILRDRCVATKYYINMPQPTTFTTSYPLHSLKSVLVLAT